MLIQRSHAEMEAEGDRLLADPEGASSSQQHQDQRLEEHEQAQQGTKASAPWSPPPFLHRTLLALCPPQALERAQRGVGAVAATAGELAKPGGSLSPRSLKLLLGAQLAAVCLLALALLLVQWQLSALRAATVPPVGELGSKEMLSRLCADSSQARALHGKFHNTVLIINTNYEKAARSTSRFLRKVYGRVFPNIVIISEKSIPELNVQARNHPKWRGEWYFAFWYIPRVVADYPDADGYLWTNDDVAINYWKLLKGNLSKLWLTNAPDHPESRYFPFDLNAQAKWGDWAGEENTRKQAGDAYINMEEQYRKQFDRSVEPLTGTYPKRIVDLYFIPRRLAKAFCLDLIPIFREFKLWSEVAIPMMFYALENPKDWDPVLDDMKYSWAHWDHTKVFDPTEHWTPDISAFHPWKLSNAAQRTSLIMSYSQADPCILQLLPEASLSD